MHHKGRRTKRSPPPRDSPTVRSHQVQIIPPAALKISMVLVIRQVNSHNPLSGHCPLNPEGVQCTPLLGPPNGKSSDAAHITRESTPLSILLLFFAEIITLPVVETNHYYHQFLDNFEDGPSPQCEVTEAEMFVFLALTLQMGHTVQDRLEDYWKKMEQLCTPCYGQRMAHSRYCHILRFLHFTDNNRNGVDRTDDRLWKI